MSMTFKKKFSIAPGFERMFEFDNEVDSWVHDAKIIQMKILNAMENSVAMPETKKELAKKLNTSASYITQLYRGDKLMNLEMMARIQEAFNIEFEVKVRHLQKPTLTSLKKKKTRAGSLQSV